MPEAQTCRTRSFAAARVAGVLLLAAGEFITPALAADPSLNEQVPLDSARQPHPEAPSTVATSRSVTPTNSDPLGDVLSRLPAEFQPLLADPKHRVQIRWIRIDRDADNRPAFTRFEFQVDPRNYFYPASTVKFAAALVALEELERLRVQHGLPQLTSASPMLTGASEPWQTAAESDPTHPSGLPSIGHYLRKVFLVSDNDAFNRLLEFVGIDTMDAELRRLGLHDTRIFHRLSVKREPEHSRFANPITFLADDRRTPILHIPARVSSRDFRHPTPIPLGVGYRVEGELVHEPKDFAGLNAFPLADQQELLLTLLFPDSRPPSSQLRLAHQDRRLILRAMGEFPRESTHPAYPASDFPDGYVKFLVLGGTEPQAPATLRILNKSGLAYGFLTDNACIVDFDSGTEFLLAATIHVNANGIYNDNAYEYDTIGLPFLRALGQAVLDAERSRPKAHPPDLSELADLFRGPGD